VTTAWAYPSGSNRLSTVTQGGTTVRSFGYDAASSLTSDSRSGTAYAYAIVDAGRIGHATVAGVIKASTTAATGRERPTGPSWHPWVSRGPATVRSL